MYSLHYDVVQGAPEALPVLTEKGEVTDVVKTMELMDPVKVIEMTEVVEAVEAVEMVEEGWPVVVKAEEVLVA